MEEAEGAEDIQDMKDGGDGEELARIFHAFCVLFPAFGGGQAVSVRERASYAG